MKHSRTVLKNSIWLILQPLSLNVLSLFVIGYIARTLGKTNFGIFNFAFAFIAIFMPFINMGISALATREIAEHQERAPEYTGKMLNLRLAMAFVIYAVLLITVNVLHYDSVTKLTIYIAGLNIFMIAVNSCANSVFQGFEKMEYMAFIQFISGLILTILSVVILWLGFGLYGLTGVYVFGSFIGASLALYHIHKLVGLNHFKTDLPFWKSSIIRGMPLFLPGFMNMLSAKIGVILLAHFSGAAAVGVFSAAGGLIEKLEVIPDGICTAIYPTMASLYRTSRDDAEALYHKFSRYLFLIGLPIAVGTTLVAEPVIILIYGVEYAGAAITLQLLSWGLFLSFISLLKGWTLSAIHQEINSAKLSLSLSVLFIVLDVILIPLFHANGIVAAMIIVRILGIILFGRLVKQHLTSENSNYPVFARIVAANAVMFVCTYAFRNTLYIAIPLAASVYTAMLFVLRVVTKTELVSLSNMFFKKKPATA